LWVRRTPEKFHERLPRVLKDEKWENVWIDGKMIRRDLLSFAEAMRPPGAYDFEARLVDLDGQGVWTELLFPSRGVWLHYGDDPELVDIGFRAYNDWLREEVMSVSPRLQGAAGITHLSTEHAVAELHRCADLGFRACYMPVGYIEGRAWNEAVWDPLWAAAEEREMPLCFHCGSGTETKVARGPGGAIINYVDLSAPIQRTLCQIIAAGVFDRYPALTVAMVEGGASWLPAIMDRMDEAFRQHHSAVRPKLDRLPSEYVTSGQVFATFQHDPSIAATISVTGATPIMFGTDYPHLEGTFPDTRKVITGLFEHVSPEDRQAITIGNLTRILKLPEPPVDVAAAN